MTGLTGTLLDGCGEPCYSVKSLKATSGHMVFPFQQGASSLLQTAEGNLLSQATGLNQEKQPLPGELQLGRQVGRINTKLKSLVLFI